MADVEIDGEAKVRIGSLVLTFSTQKNKLSSKELIAYRDKLLEELKKVDDELKGK